MGEVTDLPRSGPGVGHRTRKNAGATTKVTKEDFASDDEVVNLESLKLRMSEMLAKPDILERDFATISKDYRQVIVELQEARDRVDAKNLGARGGLSLAGGRAIDGDI